MHGHRDTIGAVTWLLWSLVIVVVVGCLVLAAGRGGGMREAYDDRPDVLVPADRRLTGDDVRAVGFTTAFRGYRMDEVDELLARLAVEIDQRDGVPEGPPSSDSAPDVTGDDRAG